jgi:hypothetical protein
VLSSYARMLSEVSWASQIDNAVYGSGSHCQCVIIMTLGKPINRWLPASTSVRAWRFFTGVRVFA